MSMPQIIKYCRNRSTIVEQVDQETIYIQCILFDPLSQG